MLYTVYEWKLYLCKRQRIQPQRCYFENRQIVNLP